MTVCLVLSGASSIGQTPPVLNTVFPAGGQAGHSVELTISGSNLQGVKTLHCNVPGVSTQQLDASRFRLTIPADARPGLCDLWAVGDKGVSAPRTFAIGTGPEILDVEPSESPKAIPLDVVINGQIDKPGDVDQFRFEAKQGQRIVIECQSERIDSRLRAVLEVFDERGRRLAVNRGYFGNDPLIDFKAPADGAYIVKLQDLISSGSAEHYYRLEIDTGPRVAFAAPAVVERGKTSRLVLYGWNLISGDLRPAQLPSEAALSSEFDRVEVEIPASQTEASWPLAVRLQPAQSVLAGASFPFYLPGSHAPVVIGVTDVPVVLDEGDNHSPSSAQKIVIPCEVSGQLTAGDEQDCFEIQARRGEVLFIEASGQRISSPVDLQVSVLDTSGQRELALFGDEVQNIGGAFPTSHLDPAGRWVCPADGRYVIAIRNLVGGLGADPRRVYRLSVRRADFDYYVVAVQRAGPAALDVPRGGREVLDILAFRRRGFDGAICVSAGDLPSGIDCPDVWLGPGVERATLVVSADRHAAALSLGELKLQAVATEAGVTICRPVHGGTIVRSGTPIGWGRLMSQIPLAVAGDAPLRVIANAHETIDHHLYGKLQPRHSPGGVVDVAVQIERRDTAHQAPVKLVGVGLPDLVSNQTAIIPADQSSGYVSFYLPPALPVGRYSLVIRAETTVPGDKKVETVMVHSNPVTIDVQHAAFRVEVDPFAVKRARRGETIRVGYTARRLNGFIGKMHTELATSGRVTDVVGLRGRGETFVGQSDSGSLQIVVNDNAPVGPQPFLRLFTVGVVEDEPIYQGSSFLMLEIVE